MVGIPCSVGLVEESITGEVFHNMRVVDFMSIVRRRHKQWGMLEKVFLEFMQHQITRRKIARHLLSRWMVIFVIKLFLFFLFVNLGITTFYITISKFLTSNLCFKWQAFPQETRLPPVSIIPRPKFENVLLLDSVICVLSNATNYSIYQSIIKHPEIVHILKHFKQNYPRNQLHHSSSKELTGAGAMALEPGFTFFYSINHFISCIICSIFPRIRALLTAWI